MNGEMMDIGTLAASNIVKALGLNESDVPTIQEAISDEIRQISAHFTMCARDMQHNIETSKSAFNYAKENPLAVWATAMAFFTAGFFLRVIL